MRLFIGEIKKDKKSEDSNELSQAILYASPKHLRQLSELLLKTADDMENSQQSWDHVHLCGDKKWKKSWPDILITKEKGFED